MAGSVDWYSSVGFEVLRDPCSGLRGLFGEPVVSFWVGGLSERNGLRLRLGLRAVSVGVRIGSHGSWSKRSKSTVS